MSCALTTLWRDRVYYATVNAIDCDFFASWMRKACGQGAFLRCTKKARRPGSASRGSVRRCRSGEELAAQGGAVDSDRRRDVEQSNCRQTTPEVVILRTSGLTGELSGPYTSANVTGRAPSSLGARVPAAIANRPGDTPRRQAGIKETPDTVQNRQSPAAAAGLCVFNIACVRTCSSERPGRYRPSSSR
jgi:hypothetical protein